MKMNIDENTSFNSLLVSETLKERDIAVARFCEIVRNHKKSASFYLAGGIDPHFNYICFAIDATKDFVEELAEGVGTETYERWTK